MTLQAKVKDLQNQTEMRCKDKTEGMCNVVLCSVFLQNGNDDYYTMRIYVRYVISG